MLVKSYFSSVGEPVTLFQKNHFDWVPTQNLGYASIKPTEPKRCKRAISSSVGIDEDPIQMLVERVDMEYYWRVNTSFRWKNTRLLRTMNESYIFQWVLCHIGFSYPLFLQTWCSVICTGCICPESAIQLSSWQSFSKYRREMEKDNIEERI